MMGKKVILGLALVLSLTAPVKAQTTLFDSGGFESYTLGALDGQNGWLIQTPNAGQFTVQSTITNGGNRAAQANGGLTNWCFPIAAHTPVNGEIVQVQADLARNLGTTSSFAYAIDIYNAAVARTFRFGLVNNAGVIQPFVTSRFNSTTGQFDPTSGVANVLVGAGVAADTFVSFDARLDYAQKNVLLYVNGTAINSGVPVPFVNLAAADFSDADFQVSSTSGANDRGFLDNYTIRVLVPEPGSLALLGLGGPGLLWALRRRRI